MNKLVFHLLSIFLISSIACNYDESFREIPREHYSLQIPSYMNAVENLHPNAKMQYSNRYRNMYVIVLSDDKTNKSFLEFRKSALKVITQYLDKPVITDSVKIKLNGLDAFETEVFGNIGDESIYYDHLAINAPDKYYEVCVWTRGPERKLRYGADMDKIAHSFKLLR